MYNLLAVVILLTDYNQLRYGRFSHIPQQSTTAERGNACAVAVTLTTTNMFAEFYHQGAFVDRALKFTENIQQVSGVVQAGNSCRNLI
jgi:hypothetical protein